MDSFKKIEIIQIINSLWGEYGFAGLILALIIFGLSSNFGKQIARCATKEITFGKLLKKFVIFCLIALFIPFFMQICLYVIGQPIDINRLKEILSTKTFSVLSLVIALGSYAYNVFKSQKVIEKAKKKIDEFKERAKRNKQQRQRRRREKRKRKNAQKNAKKNRAKKHY